MKLTRTLALALAAWLCLPPPADAAPHRTGAAATQAPAGRPPAPDTPADPSSPAVAELLARAAVPNATQAMHWVQAAQALNLTEQAIDLRNFLLQAWLTELEEGTPLLALDVGAAAAAGHAWSDERLSNTGPARWQAVAGRYLRPSVAASAVAIPDEIDALKSAMTEEGAGFWSYRHPNGDVRGLFLQLTLTNLALQPLATGGFDLDLAGRGGVRNDHWTCLPPRGIGTAALAAGASRPFLCRLHKAPALAPGQSVAQMLDDARAAGALRLHFRDFDTAPRRQALVDALAVGHRAELDDFTRRNAGCERRGNCLPALAAETPAGRDAHRAKTDWYEVGRWLGWVVGVMALIALLYRLGGPFLTIGIVFAVSAWYGWRFAHDMLTRNWADNWGGMVAIPAAMAGALLPFFVAGIVAAGIQGHRRRTDAPESRLTELWLGFWQNILRVFSIF